MSSILDSHALPLHRSSAPNTASPLLLIFLPRELLPDIYLNLHCSYQIKTFLSYSTRPLWDHPDGPSSLQAHFYAEGMLDVSSPESTKKLCELHGWKHRKEDERVDVWDAVLLVSRRAEE